MSDTEPLLRTTVPGHNINSATEIAVCNRSVNNRYDETGETVNEGHGAPVKMDKETNEMGTAVYAIRWYILLVMSLTAALQSACWATWGPIAQSAKAVYGWGTSLLALMINCGNIGVLSGCIPSGYIVHRYGLRVSLLLTTFFITLSPALRAVTFKSTLADVLIGFGQYFAGVAGSLITCTFALVSETWFPSNERTTATTVSTLFYAVGGAAAFLLGPSIVSQPQCNRTSSNNVSITSDAVCNNGTIMNISTMETEIGNLNLIEIGIGGSLFLMTLVYFPKKPRKPPSRSASVKRQNFKDGIIKILKNVYMWRVTFTCGASFSIFVNWLGLLDENLTHLGISQTQAGWFGFYALTAGTVGGVFIGRLADTFQRRLRLFLLVLLSLASLVAAFITCMRNEYIPHTDALFAVAMAMIGVCAYTTFPLNTEFACEIGFPVSEEIIGMCLGIGMNATSVTFLLIQLIPGIGISWINWTLVGAMLLPVLCMVTFRDNYHRMDIDIVVERNA